MISAADKAGVMLRVYENFVYYSPAVRARQMIEAGEIGEVRAVSLAACFDWHRQHSWDVPLSAWLWRLNEKQCSSSPLVFDHGYHLFSVAYFLGGPVRHVYAWIDRTPLPQAAGLLHIDAPAAIMFQFKAERCYGMLDIDVPKMRIHSQLLRR